MTSRKPTPLWLAGAALALVACSSDEPAAQGEFVSDFPAANSGSRGANAAALPPGAIETSDAQATSADASRAIVEADVIQLDGDRLYALSRIAGLSVIDVSDPTALALLGRYRDLPGTPFEMYLRGSVVLAMFSDWGKYVADGDGYTYVQTSKVVAIDVRDPAAMAKLDDFDVPGAISDSRVVGDVLYVVGHEDGYCWGCRDDAPQTTVVSLSVKDPRDVQQVDALAFADGDARYGWAQRSITVTDQRMYVAGPEYGQNGPIGSAIQVVDISDPAGDMVEGALVRAEGQIASRWQMDEHEGVLRVLSQPATWSNGGLAQPVLSTYQVASSADVRPLGRLPLQVPNAREQLRSVRFDGARGYAITAEQRDPLFTLDLSDPAHPAQLGELEMPGFLYHMEPRGDRLWGLGYDQGNAAGAITVTLFDVADLARPKLLSRVNFGGSWASLPEDQDRIHKVFRVLDTLGLVLVPFSGWDFAYDAKLCASPYRSGVQLVSFAGDGLTLAGLAPSRGEARRAFVHQDHLFAVSDSAVDSFDITDRAKPVASGSLHVAQSARFALPLDGGVVARVNDDYWSAAPYVDFVASDDVDAPQLSLGRVELGPLLADDARCIASVSVDQAFARGTDVLLTYYRSVYDASGGQSRRGALRIDASDPAAPVLRGKAEWDEQDCDAGNCVYWSSYGSFYDYAYTPARSGVVLAGDALVLLEAATRFVGNESEELARLRVVGFVGDEPSTALLPLSGARHGGLMGSGERVLLSRYEPTGSDGRVRFYVQELDVTDPAAPALGRAINVPGTPMHFDAEHARILTSELTRKPAAARAFDDCDARYGYFEFEYGSTASDGSTLGTCTGYAQSLQLVSLAGGRATLEGRYDVDDALVVTASAQGDDRVVAVLGHEWGGYYRGIAFDCLTPCGYGTGPQEPAQLLTLAGLTSGELQHGRLTVDGLATPWWGFWGSLPVYASGTRAIVTSDDDLAILDLRDAAEPRLVATEALYGTAQSVSFAGDEAYVALGQGGVQRLALR